MNYYERLNQAIKNTLNNPALKYQLQYFDEITKLANIIIENTSSIEVKQHTTTIPLTTSIITIFEFLSTLPKTSPALIQTTIQDPAISFQRIAPTSINKSQVHEDGSINIDFYETLDDVFTIGHEFTHKLSHQKNNRSTIKQFLGEVPTITVEFLLQDYLQQHTDYPDEEITIRKSNRISSTLEDAYAIIFENTLLKLYEQNNNCITEQVLQDYLDSLDPSSREFQVFSTKGPQYLNDIIASNSLQFYKRQRYVIGTLLASIIHQQIKSNKENYDQLIELIDILGHDDATLEQDLTKLGNLNIPIIHNQTISISSQDIETLTSSYKTELDDVSKYQQKKK